MDAGNDTWMLGMIHGCLPPSAEPTGETDFNHDYIVINDEDWIQWKDENGNYYYTRP